MDQAARREHLRQTLAELEDELREAEAVDPELHARLERTLAELRAAVEAAERDDRAPPEQHGLMDHLSDAMRRFEVTHPKLSLAVGRVVDALSNLGI
jgi:hypothetical protein